jgi:hypothetical protein
MNAEQRRETTNEARGTAAIPFDVIISVSISRICWSPAEVNGRWTVLRSLSDEGQKATAR